MAYTTSVRDTLFLMQVPPDEKLPPPLDVLWGRRGQAERRRRRGLSVERIVQAAVELADAGGLESVTMSRIAERLGVTAMALYRHVRNKNELVMLMVESTVLSPYASEDDALSGAWREGLERWSWDLLGVVRSHRWLLGVPLTTMPFGPNRLAWLERGLQALADTALGEDEKAALVLLLNNYVFAEARIAAEAGGGGPGSDEAHSLAAEEGAMLFALVDPERFPATRRALEAGIFAASRSDGDADFSFGLERILDGIERLIAERSA
jgi:AcrR family transcriptional regulator